MAARPKKPAAKAGAKKSSKKAAATKTKSKARSAKPSKKASPRRGARDAPRAKQRGAQSAKKKRGAQSAKKKRGLGAHVEQAMRDAAITERDERGLMPLAAAREVVQAATEFVRGDERDTGGTMVTDADRLWAALLSLEDAAELVRGAGRLDWRYHPRGRDNVALVERYGDGVLPWITTRVRDGVLVNVPWCVGPSLLAIGTPAAFDFVWSLRGYDDSSEMIAWEVQQPREVPGDELAAGAAGLLDAWIAAHAEVALGRLAELAEGGDARASELLLRRARLAPGRFTEVLAGAVGTRRADTLAARLKFPSGLTAEAILARLDEACANGEWPLFYYGADGRIEYFGLRVLAGRAHKGDAWGVLIQRLAGSYPDGLRIEEFTYGSEVSEVSGFGEIDQVEWEGNGFHFGVATGWGEDVELDEGLLDEHDLRFNRVVEVGYHPYRTMVIRAYLAANPAWWPPANKAIASLGLGRSAQILVDSAAFHHVIGPNGRAGTPEQPWEILPSVSPVYRSIARALADRDPAAFEAGTSNLDWRLHANTDEHATPPWWKSRYRPVIPGAKDEDDGTGRVDTWVAAAMREAALITLGQRIMRSPITHKRESTPADPDAPAWLLDDRGLLSLEAARAHLAWLRAFERGTGSRIDGQWVQGSDRTWAALLSLADGEELRERGSLTWSMPVRGADHNVAIAERYGAAAIPWIRTFVDADRTLHDRPRCLRPTLLAIGDDAALELILGLDGFSRDGDEGTPAVQRALLLDAWLAAGPDRIAALVRRAATGGAPARTLLRTRALLEPEATRDAVTAVTGGTALLDEMGVPRELSAEHVLAQLDRAASGPGEDQSRWPRFCHRLYPQAAEYHGLRLVGARAKVGDGWLVVLERITGYGMRTGILHYRYGGGTSGLVEGARRALHLELTGTAVKGPDGTVPLDGVDLEPLARLTEPPDYWGRLEARSGVAPVRAYCAVHPRSGLTDTSFIPADHEVLVDTIAFEHADGPEPPPGHEQRPWHVLPSASVAYRTLAEAIARRDASVFDAGTPNTDWHLHAKFSADEEEQGDEEGDDEADDVS